MPQTEKVVFLHKNFGIFQKTVKVVYNYNACLLTGDSNPVKTSFYPEVKSAHIATLLQDDLPPFPAAFRASLSPVLSLSAIPLVFFLFFSPLCICDDYDKT